MLPSSGPVLSPPHAAPTRRRAATSAGRIVRSKWVCIGESGIGVGQPARAAVARDAAVLKPASATDEVARRTRTADVREPAHDRRDRAGCRATRGRRSAGQGPLEAGRLVAMKFI